jgi:hypothetical protein
MGIAYRVDGPQGISVSSWTGEVTREEAMRHLAALAETPEWSSARRILTDLTGLSASALPDRDQVAEIADAFVSQLSDRAQPAKWAIVASSAFNRALQFGDEVGDSDRRVLVFLDLASACIWLGVDLDQVRAALDTRRAEARTQKDHAP